MISFLLLISFYSCKDNPTTSNSSSKSTAIDIQATWSPLGNKIAYNHQDTSFSVSGIYIIDTNGTNNKLLVNGLVEAPTWSPDGNWIAFCNHNYGVMIYKIKLNGDSLTSLTEASYGSFFPAWSSDGNWIAFETDLESPGIHYIWKMNSDGSNKTKIFFDTTQGGGTDPSWGNNKIVYLRNTGNYSGTAQIFSMDSNGQNQTELTFDNSQRYYPKISFNGGKIAYTLVTSGPRLNIWTMQSDGSNNKQILYTQGYTPAFSPDGEMIVYTNAEYGNGRIWIMSKDGKNQKQLTY
jgi:Tol biopolymer transport system component